ncbi:hypothetical protein [Oceaniglobus roseus]|uniref:hypothetical protein n=1 Tax=Oceaniglobus roseus TaxID=1737570 RepID=UPI000C7F25D6|nr:hypothetical protein [Kandeliimicrobium roseum]
MPGFSGPMTNAIVAWMKAGCPCTRQTLTSRPQVSYPNTYCIFFERPVIGGTTYDFACLDLHYATDDTLQALGSFWIDGLKGQSMQPQQDLQKSPLRRPAYNAVVALAPVPPPGHTGTPTYDSKRTALRGASATTATTSGGTGAVTTGPSSAPPVAVAPPPSTTPPPPTGSESGD